MFLIENYMNIQTRYISWNHIECIAFFKCKFGIPSMIGYQSMLTNETMYAGSTPSKMDKIQSRTVFI